MGYTHGKRWTNDEIKNEILKVMNVLEIDRMPSSVEIERVMNNTSLTNVISKRGGFEKWANDLGLTQSKCDTRIGKYGEDKIKRMLEDKGYKVKQMSARHPYDLFVNDNLKVDVKTSNRYDSEKGWSTYSFNLEKSNPTCDIYIFLCKDSERILIIPSKFLNQTQLCISSKESKYDIYKDRWDYIDQYLEFYNGIV